MKLLSANERCKRNETSCSLSITWIINQPRFGIACLYYTSEQVQVQELGQGPCFTYSACSKSNGTVGPFQKGRWLRHSSLASATNVHAHEIFLDRQRRRRRRWIKILHRVFETKLKGYAVLEIIRHHFAGGRCNKAYDDCKDQLHSSSTHDDKDRLVECCTVNAIVDILYCRYGLHNCVKIFYDNDSWCGSSRHQYSINIILKTFLNCKKANGNWEW